MKIEKAPVDRHAAKKYVHLLRPQNHQPDYYQMHQLIQIHQIRIFESLNLYYLPKNALNKLLFPPFMG